MQWFLYQIIDYVYRFNQGLELHKRLSFIEINWPYFLGKSESIYNSSNFEELFSYFNNHVLIFGLIFHILGFGLPLAFITSWPASHVVSGCVFSILFPLFIVSGNQAHVVTCDKQIEFRIFHPTVVISNAILTKTLHNNHSRQINRNQ